jgi:hypothetical protein
MLVVVLVARFGSLRRQCRPDCVSFYMYGVCSFRSMDTTSKYRSGAGITASPQVIAVISGGFNRRLQLSVHVTESRTLTPANLHRS